MDSIKYIVSYFSYFIKKIKWYRYMMHTLQKLQYLHTYDWSIGRTDEDEISSEFLPDVLRGS